MGEKETFEIRENCLVIRLPEEVDHHNAKDIRCFADHYLNDDRVEQIVFDFNETIFMDSSGIGMIMGRYKQVIFHGGKIAACGVSNEVDRILKISGLYRVMDKFDSAEDAIEAISQRTGGR